MRIDLHAVHTYQNRRCISFSVNISNDIRTPMNAIAGYTTLAQRGKNLPPETAVFLAKIENSSQHLLTLINDVLEMSRIERLTIKSQAPKCEKL